jgi:RNA polymerase sigma-70 factor, ECF subfamily
MSDVTTFNREPFACSRLCTTVVETLPSAITDEEIVDRVIRGESELFEVLVRRHNQRLFRATRAILKDVSESEDVMQEAYVRAFTHLDQFAGEAKFSTWLTKIAVYEALARLRRHKQMDNIPDEIRSNVNVEDTAYRRELRRMLEDAIDVLPPLYRAVFVLRDVEEMSGAETAECLGITEETTKTRLHRARRMLRDELRTAVGEAFTYGAEHCDRMTASTMDRIRHYTPRPD